MTKKSEPETLTAELIPQDASPGPGGRVSRSFGQGGGAVTIVQLVQAFGWLGSDDWTAEQAAQRWPAITAALFLAIAVGHNLFNWWRTERRTGVGSVTVTAESGQALYFLLVVVAVAFLALALLGKP